MTQFDPKTPNDTTPKVEIAPEPPVENSLLDKLGLISQQFLQWYDTQTAVVKIALAITAIFMALSLLTKVLHLVASIISVTILVVILYGIYRAFLQPKSTP